MPAAWMVSVVDVPLATWRNLRVFGSMTGSMNR